MTDEILAEVEDGGTPCVFLDQGARESRGDRTTIVRLRLDGAGIRRHRGCGDPRRIVESGRGPAARRLPEVLALPGDQIGALDRAGRGAPVSVGGHEDAAVDVELRERGGVLTVVAQFALEPDPSGVPPAGELDPDGVAPREQPVGHVEGLVVHALAVVGPPRPQVARSGHLDAVDPDAVEAESGDVEPGPPDGGGNLELGPEERRGVPVLPGGGVTAGADPFGDPVSCGEQTGLELRAPGNLRPVWAREGHGRAVFGGRRQTNVREGDVAGGDARGRPHGGVVLDSDELDSSARPRIECKARRDLPAEE
nr:hypothetical protein [Tsukamurella tyrosinosolvens]